MVLIQIKLNLDRSVLQSCALVYIIWYQIYQGWNAWYKFQHGTDLYISTTDTVKNVNLQVQLITESPSTRFMKKLMKAWYLLVNQLRMILIICKGENHQLANIWELESSMSPGALYQIGSLLFQRGVSWSGLTSLLKEETLSSKTLLVD